MKIRATIAFALIGVFFTIADLLTRSAVRLAAAMAGRRRDGVLYLWQRFVVGVLFGLLTRVAGARFDVSARIPGEEGHLVFCSHQSLIDIPVVVTAFRGGFPLFVARERYRTGKLLVSIMLRMYGHVFVTEGARDPRLLDRLSVFARRAKHAVVIFPEGHRTRDGDIRPWKLAGGRAILEARPWKVHVVVLDGLWQALSLGASLRNISRVRCRVVEVARHDFDPARDHSGELLDTMEREMREGLRSLRAGAFDKTEAAERSPQSGDGAPEGGEVSRAG